MGKLFQGLGGVLVQGWVFSPHLTCCSYSWTQQLRGHQSPCGIDLSGLNPDLSKPSGLGPAESTSKDRAWCMYLLLLITRSPSFLRQDYWKPVEHKRGACSEGCADPLGAYFCVSSSLPGGRGRALLGVQDWWKECRASEKTDCWDKPARTGPSACPPTSRLGLPGTFYWPQQEKLL